MTVGVIEVIQIALDKGTNGRGRQLGEEFACKKTIEGKEQKP